MLIRRQTEMADEGCPVISVSPVQLADVFGCSEKNLCELCALAPLREPGPRGRGSRKGAKALRRKVRKDSHGKLSFA